MSESVNSFIDSKRNVSVDEKAFADLDKAAANYDIAKSKSDASIYDLRIKKDSYDKGSKSNNDKRILDAALLTAKKDKQNKESKLDSLTKATKELSIRNNTSQTNILNNLKIYHDEQENKKIESMLREASKIDICFVIDASGSMDPIFNTLKNHVRSILESVKILNHNLQYQLSLVVYRDPEDGRDRHFEILPFTTSRTEFENMISKIKSGGGGDQCEDVIGALDKASKLEWRFYNRLLFLCGDAPCHGREYHNNCNDNHLTGLGIKSSDVMKQLIETKAQVFFWKINDTTNIMIDKFNQEAEKISRSCSLSFPGDRPLNKFIDTNRIDMSCAESVKKAVVDSITKSMSSSLAYSSSKATSKKDSIDHSIEKLSAIIEEKNLEAKDTLVSSSGKEI